MRENEGIDILAGFGAQKLSTLAAYAIRKNLLAWLEQHKVHLVQWQQEKQAREARQVHRIQAHSALQEIKHEQQMLRQAFIPKTLLYPSFTSQA